MRSRIIRRSRVPATSASVRETFFAAYSSGSSRHASRPVWLAVKAFAVDASLIQADANRQRSIAGQDGAGIPKPDLLNETAFGANADMPDGDV